MNAPDTTDVQACASVSGFTAHQIARALRFSRQGVFKRLSTVQASGSKIVAGKPAATWALADLPEDYRLALARGAQKGGFRSAEHLLADAGDAWGHKIVLSTIPQRFIDRAAKLRDALRETIQRQADPCISAADIEALGLRDYQRVFGCSVSARHWRRIFKRTVDRDRGNENWGRLEIYLDEAALQRKSRLIEHAVRDAGIIKPVSDVVGSFENPARPDRDERAILWSAMFEQFEACVRRGLNARRARGAIVSFVFERVPGLALSANGLASQFRRKYSAWVEADRHVDAVRDSRKGRSGRRRKNQLDREGRDRLIARALDCGGRISQAYREGRREGFIGTGVGGAAQASTAKSYVPRSIRQEIATEVRLLMKHHRGPKFADANGPYISCIHDEKPGEFFEMDDLTAPIYYFLPEDPSVVIRGQVLLTIDAGSTAILSFYIIPDSQYESFGIRLSMAKTCEEWGMPAQGWIFEHGIWLKARALKGRRGEAVNWKHAETGLRSFFQFRHAEKARGKVIERVMAAIQNHMERHPGYAGRIERVDLPERTKHLIALVKSGRIHPSQGFYSYDEWCEALTKICEDYNQEKQEGKICNGRSPIQLYQDENCGELRRLPDSCAYLLRTHMRREKVTRNGIRLVLKGESHFYKSEDTGRFEGREMFVWFDPESPDIVSVTDLDRNYLFTVARAAEISRMNATPEEIARARRENRAHVAFARSRYRSVSKHALSRGFLVRQFAPTVTDAATPALGARIEEARAAHRASTAERTARVRRVRRFEHQTGLVLEHADPGSNLVEDAARLWDEARRAESAASKEDR